MRGKFLVILLLALTFSLSVLLRNLAADSRVPRITKEELRSMLDNPDVIIVDVRVEDEWKKSEWKIKGAVRENPEGDIQSTIEKYPKDKTLVFY
jgi:rhodanese-related sulfurtransferase